MVKTVTIDEFLLITSLNYFDIKLYEVTAQTYKLDLKCLIFFNEKNIPTIGLLAYIEGKRITHPNHHHYTYLWIKDKLDTKSSRNDLYEFFSYLRLNYIEVSLKLIGLEDYRSFINNDFELKLRYTFIKKTEDISYKYNVQKHYNRAINIYNILFVKVHLNQVLNENLQFLIENKIINVKETKEIKKLLINLNDEGLLLCFSINNNSTESILASGIVLLNQNKAYFLFCNTKTNKMTSAVNSYMYIKLQDELKNKAIYELDYMGANISNIAEFKNNFNPKLTPYFIVNYKKSHIKNIVFYYKQKIKSMINL